MKVIIIGCGVAGVTAAREIKSIDKNIDVKVITKENHAFYSRPRIFELLHGYDTKRIMILRNDWFEKNNIELIKKHEVSEIDVLNKHVTIKDKGKYYYDKLLISTGAIPLMFGYKDLFKTKNVFLIRKIDDMLKIRESLLNGIMVAVIGGGLLGLELADNLNKLGFNTNIVEYFPRLLPKQLDVNGSRIIENEFSKRGIKFYMNKKIKKINIVKDKQEILFEDELRIKSDMLLFAVGVKPDIALAKKSGMETEKGILVNEYMETTLNDIYAAGGCIEFNEKCFGTWLSAREQGMIAGNNICDKKMCYTGLIEPFDLNVAGIHITSVGNIDEDKESEIVTEFDVDKEKYVKLVKKDNKLIGAIVIGDKEKSKEVKKLVG